MCLTYAAPLILFDEKVQRAHSLKAVTRQVRMSVLSTFLQCPFSIISYIIVVSSKKIQPLLQTLGSSLAAEKYNQSTLNLNYHRCSNFIKAILQC